MTFPQALLLLQAGIAMGPNLTPARALEIVKWVQMRNREAARSHRKRRLRELAEARA